MANGMMDPQVEALLQQGLSPEQAQAVVAAQAVPEPAGPQIPAGGLPPPPTAYDYPGAGLPDALKSALSQSGAPSSFTGISQIPGEPPGRGRPETGLQTGYGGIEGFSPSFAPTTAGSAMDDALTAKAQERAMSVMRKRMIQEQQTGEPQPGPSYAQVLEQEKTVVKAEFDEAKKKSKQAAESGGMGVFEALTGGAPPKVDGEYVFPPGDMRQSPAYQSAKAEADAAAEVTALPGDETLGGTDPEDTPPLEAQQEEASYPAVEKPGDLRRAAAQRKISQLSALRDIAEGGMRMGNIPVAGDYAGTGPPRPFIAGQPQQAGGIRNAISQLQSDENLYLKSQLRQEEIGAEYGHRAQEERVKAQLDNMGIGPDMLTRRQQDQLLDERKVWLGGATEKKANDALAAVRAGIQSLQKGPQGEAPPGQAQVLAARQVLQAYGEGSRMSDQDIRQILNDPILGGMYDEAYRFVTGKTTPKTVRIYKDMLNRLGKATRNFINDKRKVRAKSFSSATGIPSSVVMKSFGGLMEGEGGKATAAPEGAKVMVTKDGKVKQVLEKDLDAWQTQGWTRA